MKKTIIAMFLALIMVSSVLAVINGMEQRGDKIGDKTTYMVGVKVEKGWNLILGVTGDIGSKISKASDIQLGDIKAIYGFNPITKNYMTMYPNPSTSDVEAIHSVNGDELVSSAFWVYSDKEGYLRFVSEYTLDLDKRALRAGWNFVAITPEFRNKQFQTVFADCTVEKAYSYNNRIYTGHTSPSWERVRGDTTFTGDAEGTGFVVKISEECRMMSQSSGANASPPPELPQ